MIDYPLEVLNPISFISSYTFVVQVMIFVNTFSLLFMLYIVTFYGKNMSFYPWLLFAGFTAGYLLDLLLFTGHLIQFLPLTLFYFDGILGKHIGSKFMLCLMFCFLIIKLLMLNLILLYRYSMSVGGKMQEFMSTGYPKITRPLNFSAFFPFISKKRNIEER